MAYVKFHGVSSTELTDAFQDKISEMVDNHFPLKTMTITDSDQPWITKDLKKLKRSRQREYCRHGKSNKYHQLKDLFNEKKAVAVNHYTDKVINEVRNGSKTSSYKALRKLGVRKGETKDDLFVLPSHAEQHLTEEESAEKIADFFSSISQEFEPLDFEKLPPNIKHSLVTAKDDPDIIPKLDEFDVYQKILKAKKPNSVILGDVPKKIIQLFSPELALPVSKQNHLFFGIPKTMGEGVSNLDSKSLPSHQCG